MSKNSLALALSMKRRAKKMNQGGEVKKTIGEMIGFPGTGPKPIKKAFGGEVESRGSLADAIRAKNKVQPDDALEVPEDEFPEANEAAAEEVSEGSDDYDHQNRIAEIRRKRMSRR